MTPETITLLYTSLIRSIIEYGRIIWFRHTITITKNIESIQKQFVIYALRNSEKRDENHKLRPYKTRCNILQSLERRRANNETFFIHKLILGKIRAPFLYDRIVINQNIHSLRNQRPLIVSGKITNEIEIKIQFLNF